MKSKNTMRGARLEPDSGYVQYLDACAAFLSRANHVLEEITAFDELEELARHDSPATGRGPSPTTALGRRPTPAYSPRPRLCDSDSPATSCPVA